MPVHPRKLLNGSKLRDVHPTESIIPTQHPNVTVNAPVVPTLPPVMHYHPFLRRKYDTPVVDAEMEQCEKSCGSVML